MTLEDTDSSSTAVIASWTAAGLPPGLGIDAASGLVSATPTTPGSYESLITATGSAGHTGTLYLSWAIQDTVVPASPGTESSVTADAIHLTLQTSDSSKHRSVVWWAATGLPAGLTVSTRTGVVSGTPTVDGRAAVGGPATIGGKLS